MMRKMSVTMHWLTVLWPQRPSVERFHDDVRRRAPFEAQKTAALAGKEPRLDDLTPLCEALVDDGAPLLQSASRKTRFYVNNLTC